MAIVRYVPYHGGQIHAERTNEYIANGHGDEVLVRTNRYITGEHACGNCCVGVNCPSDPALATELMDLLREQYEYAHGGKLKGATNASQGAAHYQLIISWHTDEDVPVKERYEMGRELIDRTKLRGHANLMAAHDNTEEDHLHISVSAHSLDAQSKLCMNNALLYELRREMDRICVEHGFSIIQSPELMGDEDYATWFEYVQDQELVTIHPPLPASDKTDNEKYSDAKKEEREAEEALQELLKPHGRTPENQGTDFYSLPHVYDPDKPDEQLYVFALDNDGHRSSPLILDLTLQYVWARKCETHISKMADFPGKRYLELRMKWARENAGRSFALVKKLDIGTMAELEAHTEAVGGDISKYRQELARQEKVIATAKETANEEKLRRALERKRRAQQMLDARKKEYREIKRVSAVLSGMDNGTHWETFRHEIVSRSTKKLFVTEKKERMIRTNYRDIGQLLGVPQEEIDRLIAEAQAATADRIEDMWSVNVGCFVIHFTRRKSGLSAIYDYVGEQYKEFRKIHNFYRWLEYEHPLLCILYMIVFDETIDDAIKKENERIEQRIAYAKRTAETIRWHNDHCEDQFKRAKSTLAIKLMCSEAEAAAKAWDEFEADCDRLLARTKNLREMEQLYADHKRVQSTVRSMEEEIAEAKELRKVSIDDNIAGAAARHKEQLDAKEHHAVRYEKEPTR